MITMAHYTNEQAEKFFKQKIFFPLICFTCFFLVHLACIGTEPTKETDCQKRLSSGSSSKRVSFSSNDSSDSLSPPSSSRSFSSSNSSPIPEDASVDSQSNENNSCPDKKRSRLTRSLSFYKKNEKCPKADQKSPSTPKEKKLSLSDLLAETTTVLHETDEKKEIEEELLSLFVNERGVCEALINLEGAAFEKLEGAYPRAFVLSLRELVFQSFPGRVENLKLRLAEYDKKREHISTSASLITLTIKQVIDYWSLKQMLPLDVVRVCMGLQYWINNSELAYLQRLKLGLNPSRSNFPWSLSNVHQFASALYLRDAATFQAINPGDMLLHLINKDHASKEAIITLTQNYETTVDTWVSQIVNEKDEKNKKTLVKNFAYLERLLNQMHNYHGASQVDACLTGRLVSHLWATNQALNPSKIDPYWTNVHETMTLENNYKLYREQLLQSQNNPAYLPNFMVIVHDLAFLLDSSFGEEPDKVLPGLAISLEPLLKLKTIPPLIHFSSLIKKEKETDNPFLKHSYDPSKIEEDSLK
jgi:hypothetical protein